MPLGATMGVSALLRRNLVDVNLPRDVAPTHFRLFPGLSAAASGLSGREAREEIGLPLPGTRALRWATAFLFAAVPGGAVKARSVNRSC